jgi:Holliday junction DNA helicase RuvA
MPGTQLASLAVGKEVKIYTYTAVREDAILLYGFLTREYYDLFTLLLTVSGVGPKGASNVLSAVKPDAFYLAVQSKDLKALTALPGIGKKTAERMVLELKDKVGTIAQGKSANAADVFDGRLEGPVGEAVEALKSFGYTNSEIWTAIKAIPNYTSLSAEVIVRDALKSFGRRK